MELKYSIKGIPYIEFDSENRIIFSESTSTQAGYKWLAFSGVSTITVALSSGKGKKKVKTSTKQSEKVSFMMKMDFSGIPKSARKNEYLSKKYLDGIKRMFDPYVNDGVFGREHINKLAIDINNEYLDLHPEDTLDEDPNGYYEDDEEDE